MTTNGDIEQLFRTHYAAMYRLAMLILRDDAVSRDIVHDVFEALLVAGKSEVTCIYLLAAVRNRCLKHVRSLSALERMKEVYSIDTSEIADEEWPDDTIITLIRATVSNDLTEACRRVVNLRFKENKSYQEISEILGISRVAVYKHLRHAIDVLRQKISKNG
ncbi:MAG: sigma-70 family RNA polymerase sigma factor [Muribaculaceae bacterium]|nr:sigma-70 family RNA polymerase sigma factor [Muribaculaceae bacterium]